MTTEESEQHKRRTVRPEDVGKERLGYIRLLRQNRSVRRLLAATFVSGIGDWFNWLALLLVVGRGGGVYDAVGLIVVLHSGLPVVLGPLAGYIADKFDRRRVMIACDAARALIVVGLLVVSHSHATLLMWPLVIAQYTLGAIYTPCSEALLPKLAGPDDLKTANGLLATIVTGAGAIGSMLGGAAVAFAGGDIAFALDAATFVASVLLVFAITSEGDSPQAAQGESEPEVARPTSLFRHLQNEPRAAAGLLAVLIVGISGGLLWLAVVWLGRSVAPIGEGGSGSIGVLNGVTWLGGMIGSAIFNGLFSRDDDRAQVQACLRLTGLRCAMLLGMSATPWLATVLSPTLAFAYAIVVMTCFSLPGGALWVGGANFASTYTPDGLRGRMFALMNGLWLASQAGTVFLVSTALEHGVTFSSTCIATSGVVLVLGFGWVVVRVRWDRWSTPAAK